MRSEKKDDQKPTDTQTTYFSIRHKTATMTFPWLPCTSDSLPGRVAPYPRPTWRTRHSTTECGPALCNSTMQAALLQASHDQPLHAICPYLERLVHVATCAARWRCRRN